MAVLTVVIVIGLLATAGVLLTGIVSMGRGGQFDQLHSHQLMFARVGLQGITLIVLLVASLIFFW
ncbi:MAG: HIG1 domain-containing protein [Acidiferrobacterales bacterium]